MNGQYYERPPHGQHDDSYQDPYYRQEQQQQQYPPQQSYERTPPRNHPGAHPDSSFHRDRRPVPPPQEQRYDYHEDQQHAQAPRYDTSPSRRAPPPPQHGHHMGGGGGYYEPEQQQQQQQYRQGPSAAHSIVTPGADNFGAAASGGMAGIAYTVAERNARESGMEAMHGSQRVAPRPSQAGVSVPQQAYGGYNQRGDPYREDSTSSLQPLGMAAAAPARGSPYGNSPYGDGPYNGYRDDPYQGLSRTSQTNLGVVNPHDIADDGDDDIDLRRGQRRSMLSMRSDNGSRNGAAAATAAGAGAGAGAGVMGAFNMRRSGGPAQYDPVNTNTGYQGAGSNENLGAPPEKSVWLEDEGKNKRAWRKWVIIGVVILIVVGAVVGGIFGSGVLNGDGDGDEGGGGGLSADEDERQNGDLGRDSSDIQALMGNEDLHRVFPGMDYTPLNTQYPECIHNPPSQNNITRDIAVLSQLTNVVRLYGTDCNQTQMVLHAIERLEMQDDMKVWMGVWQDANETTNARQLDQMWDILEEYGQEPFAGLIVANEILFREEMEETTLASLLGEVKTNLTARGMSLPVATSDLGDRWNAAINQTSDYIMANIHPFFSGVNAREAADWTMAFWETSNGRWWRSDIEKNVIAETGWPTQGGMSCGVAGVTDCPDGSVAGIDELNAFMEDWVCQALRNGTEYFWFEAFDEPWKVRFNEEGREWEDQWGLMDVNRRLKGGVKIPDCGGETVGRR